MTATEHVFGDPATGGTYVAHELLKAIDAAAHAERLCLLGMPTGRSPKPVLTALVAALAAAPRVLSHVRIVLMDEYLVGEASSGLTYASADEPWSCHAFARTAILEPINAVLPPGLGIDATHVWCPDPLQPDAYDVRLADAGGVDVFLLASGASDGHVAFNPPGSAVDTRTRIIPLSDATRRDNLLTFPSFGTLDAVPFHGVSVGVGTLLASRRLIMIAWGAAKRETVRRMRAARHYEPDWPATLIQAHNRAELVIDRAASDGV
jgi:glucosamine-6-phosphate deaminase